MKAYSRLWRWMVIASAGPTLCWFPASAQPARLSALTQADDCFQFTLEGRPGARYAIEFSTNLLTWTPLCTNYELTAIRTIRADAPGDIGFCRAADMGRPYFQFALTASQGIYSSSGRISADSFDSTDPLASTDGRYDASKARERGDVVCLNEWPGTLVLSNAQIAGTLRTVPGALPLLGPRSAVGSKAWLLSGQTGIEPGHFATNVSLSLPAVALPFAGGFAPGGQWITNVANSITNVAYYDYVLRDGNYNLSRLFGSVYVKGRAALYVTTGLSMIRLVIETNQSLDLYCAAESASIAGNHDRPAPSFRFWGLPSCQTLSIFQATNFVGVIYAPNADAYFSIGGNIPLEFSGALVSRCAWFSGRVNLHFDESLIRTGPVY